MAQYMARVELFGANSEDYEKLHARMDAMGIEREVEYEGNVTYEMPTGTYFGSSSLHVEAVRDKIRGFANPLSPDKDAAIFVVQVKDGQWSAFLYQS